MAKVAVDVQAEIADDERAARAACRICDPVVRHFDEVGIKAAFPGQEARQHLRGTRGSVERDGGHLFPWHLAHQHNRAHRAAAGDANAGHHTQFFHRGGVAGDGHEPQSASPAATAAAQREGSAKRRSKRSAPTRPCSIP